MRDEEKTCWVIRYGNYDPAEIDSIHASKTSAAVRLLDLDDRSGWEIETWVLRDDKPQTIARESTTVGALAPTTGPRFGADGGK